MMRRKLNETFTIHFKLQKFDDNMLTISEALGVEILRKKICSNIIRVIVYP